MTWAANAERAPTSPICSRRPMMTRPEMEERWAELERLAKAATPGEWRVAEDNNPFADGRHVFATGADGTDFVVLNLKTDHTFATATSREQQQRNALFSAAANPDAIRALLSERRKMVEALTRQTDNMAFVLNRVELPPAWLEKFDRELDEARAALTGSREQEADNAR